MEAKESLMNLPLYSALHYTFCYLFWTSSWREDGCYHSLVLCCYLVV